LSLEWIDAFDRFLGRTGVTACRTPRIGGRSTACRRRFWSVHQFLKSRMLQTLRQRLREQHFRNDGSGAHSTGC